MNKVQKQGNDGFIPQSSDWARDNPVPITASFITEVDTVLIQWDGKSGPDCVALTVSANVGASVTLVDINGEAVPAVPLKGLHHRAGWLFSACVAPSRTAQTKRQTSGTASSSPNL